ncbi:cytosolic Fe-S cluster assembly factor NAR1 [Pseudomassariella vexata]|uniref:Cytosolic Fe-S cluster assembly factor NAR1 n=1 Tax=Pseudomassariella vexata TaxID=1141098 RepID=A0A1Y2DE46_9PEZI|nr:cytosolic Fe-S cluster assembly factor NAR1 [Pseudomassariella vexata]ORY57538.1 cytosolic Fe-S cluster assembly factor NAR1 [Pseudomassariella vexata]
MHASPSSISHEPITANRRPLPVWTESGLASWFASTTVHGGSKQPYSVSCSYGRVLDSTPTMSAILSADDLNDFISPGVACIKPVETLPAPPPPNDDAVEYEVVLDGPLTSIATNEPAQISLTDCLACSGCVTSAEAVLVSLQSHSEVLSVLDQAPGLRPRQEHGRWQVDGLEDSEAKLFIASVSPQTRASLAAATGGRIGEKVAGNMIAQLLAGESGLKTGGKHNNAFTWVVDTNTAREACLVLGAEEALSGIEGSGRATKPILSASCPGWVCYAEKTHPHVLPHLSRVKSPQALMGTLLKTTLSRTLGISPDRIWHLAVMPCFDKKLEASREELTDSVWGGDGESGRGVRDVDCVITSKEVLMLTESRAIDFFNLSQAPITPSQRALFPDPKLDRFLFPPRARKQLEPAAGTSGGNLYYTLQYVSSQHPGSRIESVKGRNVDVVEFNVVAVDGKSLFKAARYYGFRNIQNLVRRLKPARPSRLSGGRPVGGTRKQMEYAYVEVMACPGGCTNGGGQIKIEDPIVTERKGLTGKPGPLEQKEWLAQVDEAYFSAEEPESEVEADAGESRAPTASVGGISHSYIRDTLTHWSSITGVDAERLAMTTYREVISDVGKNKPSETERIARIAGKIGGGW